MCPSWYSEDHERRAFPGTLSPLPAVWYTVPVKSARRISAVLLCIFLASCPKGLNTTGYIYYAAQTQDQGLTSAASRLSGMTLQQETTPEYWSILLKENGNGPRPHDLFTVDWGQELVSAQKAGGLATLKNLWPRTAASRSMPPFSGSISPTPSEGFIPSALYTWGLFYNRKLYADLGSPQVKDMESLVVLLEAVKARGIIPIALGTSFGWPGAAWFSYADLRLNGGKTAWERVMGKRPFNDKSGLESANLLASWRDAGYFSPDADRSGMEESLRAVESGKALFVLMGSFASQRFANPSDIGFMEVPFWKHRGEPRGEMIGLVGFAIPAAGKAPEAALALVDEYVAAGSPGHAAESYRLPIRFHSAEGDDLRAIQSRMLSRTRWVFPSEDRIMPPQFVQDTIILWSAFFAPGTGGNGAALVGALQGLNAKSVR
jgi:hypothetical protein